MIPKKGYFIPRTRTAAIVPQIWNNLSQTGAITAKIYGRKLKLIGSLFNHRETTQVYYKKDWDEFGRLIFNKFLRDAKFFPKILRLHNFYGQVEEKSAQEIVGKLEEYNFSQLLEALVVLKKNWLAFDQVNVPAWFVAGDSLRDYLTRQLKKYGSDEIEQETFLRANTISLTTQQDILVLKSAQLYKNGNNIEKNLKYLSQEFGWIPFGYDGPVYWNENYFRTEIKKLAKKPGKFLIDKIKFLQKQSIQTKKYQKKRIHHYKFDKNLQRLIKITQDLFIITDERKKFHSQTHYAYFLVIQRLSKICGVSPEELKTLDTQEILEMFRTKQFSKWKNVARRRVRELVYIHVAEGKVQKIEMGKSVLKYYRKFTEKLSNISEVKGQVGNKNKANIITGKIRIIASSSDMFKMKKGEILLTAMTTPDFLPAIRKAKAIVTDEGGITCHAAIVSRELGIPCIIGTKIATKVFKDGDLVEVNANKGIVRKL